jgi:hypothetical protein
MKKIFILFMFGLCLQSCVKLECSNEEPVYRVEDKTRLNNMYYIKLSKLSNPDSLENKQFGFYTWDKLDKGDKLDKNYRLTK